MKGGFFEEFKCKMHLSFVRYIIQIVFIRGFDDLS